MKLVWKYSAGIKGTPTVKMKLCRKPEALQLLWERFCHLSKNPWRRLSQHEDGGSLKWQVTYSKHPPITIVTIWPFHHDGLLLRIPRNMIASLKKWLRVDCEFATRSTRSTWLCRNTEGVRVSTQLKRSWSVAETQLKRSWNAAETQLKRDLHLKKSHVSRRRMWISVAHGQSPTLAPTTWRIDSEDPKVWLIWN